MSSSRHHNTKSNQQLTLNLAPNRRPVIGLLELIEAKLPLVEQHLLRYRLDDSAGCKLWTGPLKHSKRPDNDYGTASFKIQGVTYKVKAHRLAYAYHHGIDPGDLLVCHKCDNPRCIAHDHLFLGTNADNMKDMVAKGRSGDQSGESNPRSVLNCGDVDFVVSLLPKLNNKQIAARLDHRVSHGQISLIRRGKSWQHRTGITAKSG